MKADYTYCLSEECIHRRGCKRWIGNYSEDEVKEMYTLNRFIKEIDYDDCIRDEELEDKYGNPIPTAYNHLDRFRYSDGREFE